jgi:mannose-6-phosphate isomerase-like protein (cupin superfamily)
MITKTNLLAQTSDEENGFNIQVLPEIPGLKLVYEYQIELFANQEFLVKMEEAEQEVLYCLSGEGLVKVSSSEEEETITRGDRIIFDTEYRIYNQANSLLIVLRKGINISHSDKVKK